jgi:hypothetical protein
MIFGRDTEPGNSSAERKPWNCSIALGAVRWDPITFDGGREIAAFTDDLSKCFGIGEAGETGEEHG